MRIIFGNAVNLATRSGKLVSIDDESKNLDQTNRLSNHLSSLVSKLRAAVSLSTASRRQDKHLHILFGEFGNPT